MITDPGRWERLARTIVQRTAATAGALLALAMLLSYTGLRAFYLGAGLPGWAASLYPLTVDLLALVGYVALLVLTGKVYPGAVVAITVTWSAAAQGYHLSHGGVAAKITDGRVIFLAGASAMICAGLAGHLMFKILERALPADFVTAMREPDPITAPMSVPADRIRTGRQGTLVPTLHLPPLETIPSRDQLTAAATVTGPSQITVPAGRPPAKIPTPTGGASQATGPCVPTCKHHTGAVSKSTRYRCADGGTCPTCHPKETH